MPDTESTVVLMEAGTLIILYLVYLIISYSRSESRLDDLKPVFDLSESKKLHLGCGNLIKKGWINHDLVNLPGVDVVHDLNEYPWPWENESFDEVHMANVLEHLPNTIKVMEELYRITKLGAKIYIEVPYWNSWEAITDPTHVTAFNEFTFDFFDPHHIRCQSRPYYSHARFRITKQGFVIHPLLPYIKIPRISREYVFFNKYAKKILGILASFFNNIIIGLNISFEKVEKEKNRKQTLLIPIFLGMSYRNFVSTGIIKKLGEKYHLLFLVEKNSSIEPHLVKNGYEVAYMTYPNSIYSININRLFNDFLNFEKLQYYSFYQKHKTETIAPYIERDKIYFKRFRSLYMLAKIMGLFFSKYRFLKFHYRIMLSPDVKEIINNVDKVLLLSTDLVTDKSILAYCNLINRDVFVAVHSWDNLPSRGYLAGLPTKLLAWNNVMVEHGNKFHGIKHSNIEIIGVPQFSYYRGVSKKLSINHFRQFYGIKNHDKKVITYTSSAQRVFPDEILLIDKLVEFTKNNGLYLVIRLHPTERQGDYIRRYGNSTNVIIDKPGGEFAATVVDNVNDADESIEKFVSLMKYSDVVINLGSTIALDAIIFDTPVVCPAFNLHPEMKGKWNEAYKWYNSTHFKKVVESKAIRLASSREEMEAAIQSYIDNPDLDKEFRKKLADDFCMINMDASQRICDAIN